MAEPVVLSIHYEHHTICRPITEEHDREIIDDPKSFCSWLDQCHQEYAELFPPEFCESYMK